MREEDQCFWMGENIQLRGPADQKNVRRNFSVRKLSPVGENESVVRETFKGVQEGWQHVGWCIVPGDHGAEGNVNCA